jgi:hypothetical protein
MADDNYTPGHFMNDNKDKKSFLGATTMSASNHMKTNK